MLGESIAQGGLVKRSQKLLFDGQRDCSGFLGNHDHQRVRFFGQTDRRPVSGAERVKVPVERVVRVPESETPAEASEPYLGSYTAFEIVNPEPNQTLRDAEGKVELS